MRKMVKTLGYKDDPFGYEIKSIHHHKGDAVEAAKELAADGYISTVTINIMPFPGQGCFEVYIRRDGKIKKGKYIKN